MTRITHSPLWALLLLIIIVGGCIAIDAIARTQPRECIHEFGRDKEYRECLITNP